MSGYTSCASIRLASARSNCSRETSSANCSRPGFMPPPAPCSYRLPHKVLHSKTKQSEAREIHHAAAGDDRGKRKRTPCAGGRKPPLLRPHGNPESAAHRGERGQHFEEKRGPTRLGLVN